MSFEYWKCLILIIVILGVVTLLSILILKYVIIPEYQKKFFKLQEESCQAVSYLDYRDIPPNLDVTKYNPLLAKALLSYTINVSHSNCGNLGSLPKPLNFNPYRLESTVILHNGTKVTDMFAYLFHSAQLNYIVISFTGTFFLSEWYEDIQVEAVPVDQQLQNTKSDTYVHSGFINIYNGLKVKLRTLVKQLSNPNTKVFITGISLGGALATIAAIDLLSYHPIVYTFASPRVFNNAGAILLNLRLPHLMRVYNTEDIIPDLPFAANLGYNYTHTGVNIPFTLNLGSARQNHVQAYIDHVGS